MAGHGSPKGIKQGGRAKGTPNKVTQDIRELAAKHGAECIAGLFEMSRTSRNEQVRVACWKELLDRGYGRPRQPVGGDEGPPIRMVVEIRDPTKPEAK